MGVKFPGKNSYVTLEWPPEAIQVLCNAMGNGGMDKGRSALRKCMVQWY